MTSFVERYRSGHEAEVWRELRELGGLSRSPEFIDDARAVCDEMARRALYNVETVIARLQAEGFRFTTADGTESRPPRYAPSPNASALVGWLNENLGTLPLALESWIRIVGDVSFIGIHPEWARSIEADPLVIEVESQFLDTEDPRDYYADELDMWRDTADPANPEPFLMPVAPDGLHKANISGGAPYGFYIPDTGVEGLFRNESTNADPLNEPFVDYMNRCFAAGGFPGGRVQAPAGLTERLGEGLLPL